MATRRGDLRQDAIQLALIRRLVLETDRPRELRQKAHLSLRDVAAHCRTTPTTVCRWEHQVRAPRGAAAIRYLELLARLASE